MLRLPWTLLVLSLELGHRVRFSFYMDGKFWVCLRPRWFDFSWWIWSDHEKDMSAWHFFKIEVRVAMFRWLIRVSLPNLDNRFPGEARNRFEQWMMDNDKCVARWRICF